mmetsp:Transcript_30511/g.97348  ORF Transcript_30511/g.97348 Transcript_30511/m.97348 type:complete len:207 (-) Transcript_30511:3048-3668(-)
MLRTVVVLSALACAAGFQAGAPLRRAPASVQRSTGAVYMGYVPSGMSPEQWKKIQEKEKAKSKGKNLGATGITKFQSRSFQAWQESGAKHLFPTDPTGKKKEELPYMMRRGGSWDGEDIKGKGVGQGRADTRTQTDDKYDKLKKKGQLDSVSIFGGASLPWSNDATRAQGKPQQSAIEKKMEARNNKKSAAADAGEDKPKKFFGLF